MRLLELYQILDQEAELLFELRNVYNTKVVKDWARMQASFMAQPFEQDQAAYDGVGAWAQKALIKYAIEELPAEPVVVTPMNKVWDGSGFHDLDSLAPWAQQAIASGDLVFVEPSKHTTKRDSPIGGNIRAQVTDWLRYMYQQDPRNLTAQRLGHYSWTDAIQAMQEYHLRLAAEQEKLAKISDVVIWYMENKERLFVELDKQQADIMSKIYAVLQGDASSGTQGITPRAAQDMSASEFKAYFGDNAPRIIRAFENSTGKKISIPEDDPSGLEPYLRYNEQDKKIEDDDFEPAPEIGPQWVKLKTAQCAEYEGHMMGHCVGGYGREVESGEIWIYSFRDAKNEPHITIEIDPGYESDDQVTLSQVKGKQNAPPVAKYYEKVVDFLKKIGMKHFVNTTKEGEQDLMAMGLFVENTNDMITIQRPSPPIDFSKFIVYTMEKTTPEDDEEDWPPEDNKTDEEEGDLRTLLHEKGLSPEYYFNDVVKSLMAGESCWNSEPDTDWESDVETFYTFCYTGDTGWTQREWETII